jgi:hypothetical protein
MIAAPWPPVIHHKPSDDYLYRGIAGILLNRGNAGFLLGLLELRELVEILFIADQRQWQT